MTCTVMLPGCQFVQLQSNLDQLDRASRLPVQVTGLPGEPAPVITALLTPTKTGLSVMNYAVMPASGKVELPVTAGDHYLVAFHDLNGNFRFDPDEPGAFYGEPAPLRLVAGRTHRPVKLVLSAGASRPDTWPREFRERVKQITLEHYLPVAGDIVTLNDPRFDQTVVHSGLWSPAAFLKAGGRTGTYLLEPYTPQKHVVLLVHGINGSPRDMAPLVTGLRRQGMQSWAFYYPSALRINDLSELMARSILTLRARYRPASISILAYSMGGLVARDAVRKLALNGESAFIDQLITLATPFGGISSAATGVQFAPTVIPSWIDIASDSKFLTVMADYQLPATVAHRMLIAAPDDESGVRAADDGVATATSQLRLSATAAPASIVELNETHASILTSVDTLRHVIQWLRTEAPN